MTSPDPDIEPLIDALRADLPEPKEADRLRARLTAAGIIAGGVVAAPSTAAGTQGLSALGGAQAGVVSKAAAMVGGSKVLLAAVVLAGSALPVAAYLASSSTEKAESRAVARDVEALERQVALPGATSSAPRTVATAELPVATPSEREPARPEAKTVAIGERPVALPPAPLAPKLRAAQSGPTNEPRTGVEAPPARGAVATFAALDRKPAESTLREETELMDRALSALRSENHDAARSLLREHAARFPRGALAPERERALERLKQAELSETRAKER